MNVAAAAVAFALALPPVMAMAQPRSILPSRPAIEAQPDVLPAPRPDDAMPDANGVPGAPQDQDSQPLPPPRLPNRGPAIEVGSLGTIEGPVAGLLDDSNGGLGYNMWQGIDRATVMAMLQSAPAATASEAQRLLMRKLLLTAAPPPSGAADMSFNALRLTKLLDAGLTDDAADLALKMDAPMSAEILRAQADALVLAGRMEMCGDITRKRFDSAEPFWAELRAYCYASAGDTAALDLTRSVLDEQGITDPAFLILLDGMLAGKGTAPEVIHLPDSIQLAMLQKLKLPIPADMEMAAGLSASLAIAASVETPRPVRLAAAERALRAGVLPTPLLEKILDTYTFPANGLNGAPALARVEPLMPALARLRASLKAATRADARAELIHTAFQVGEREGVLEQVALLFADEAAAIIPPRDWGNWSELMMRGLLLAGQADAAARWYAILNPDQASIADQVKQLQLTLALAAPDVANDDLTQSTLAYVATRASTLSRVAGGAGRTALALGLFDALHRRMPPEASSEVDGAMMQVYPGRRPAPALMQRLDRAAAAGSRGEVALSVVTAMGSQGVRDLAPDVIVRLVRALERAGINDAADSLAMEAMLLRPASGA